MRVESPACLWGQAFSLPPGFCPASRHKREERRLIAGGRLKAWPHLGAPHQCVKLDHSLWLSAKICWKSSHDNSDLSWHAEDAVIQEGCQLFRDLPAPVQIRNQARVH